MNAAPHRTRFSGLMVLMVGLALAQAAAFGFYVAATRDIRAANDRRIAAYQLADAMRQSSDALTREARTFVVTGDEAFRTRYRAILEARDGIPAPAAGGREAVPAPTADLAAFALSLPDRERLAGIDAVEQAKLAEAKAATGAVTATESEAMRRAAAARAATDAGDRADLESARQLLFDARYLQARDAVRRRIDEFSALNDRRMQDAVQDAERRGTALRILIGVLGVALALALWRTHRALSDILGGSVDDIRARIVRLGERVAVAGPAAPTARDERGVLLWLTQTESRLEDFATERRRVEAALAREAKGRRLLFESAKDGCVVLDAENRVVEVNESFAAMLGHTKQALLALHPWDWDAVYTTREALRARWPEIPRDPATFETRMRRRDGTILDVEVSASPFDLEDGRYVLCACRDITGRKRMQRALEESELQFRRLVEQWPDEIARYDLDCRRTYVNPAMQASHGPSAQLVGLRPTESYPASPEIAFLEAKIRDVLANGVTQDIELNGAVPAPSPRHRLVRLVAEHGTDGAISGVLAIGRDVSAMKAAEVALRDNEARLRTLVQTIPDLVWAKDADGVYLHCNRQFERLYGATEAEILGKTDYDFVDRATADFFRAHDRKAMEAGGSSVNEEWLTFKADGYRGRFETIKTPLRDAAGRFMGVLGIARDVTDRTRADEALAESETRFRKLFEETQQAALLIDGDRFVDCNRAAMEMLRMDTVEQVRDLLPSELSPEFQPDGQPSQRKANEMIALAFEKGGHVFEWEHVRADGERFMAEVMLTPILHRERRLLHVVWRDITESKRTQRRLVAQLAFTEAVIDAETDGVAVWHHVDTPPYTRFTVWNRSMERLTGYTQEEINRLGWYQSLYPDPVEREAARLRMQRSLDGEVIRGREGSITRKGGEVRAIRNHTAVIVGDEQQVHVLIVMHDVTERRRFERQGEVERAVLETLARGGALPPLLDQLARGYEAIYPGLLCSIVLLDDDGRHMHWAATPNLPREFVAATEGAEIGPDKGSCGAAIFSGRTAIVSDVATDDRWRDLRALARSTGIAASWSVPVISSSGKVLGAIALYHRAPRAPQPGELAAIERGAHLVSLAVERQRAEAARESLELQLRESQKMEAIGTLAGGVAHDFNNILGAILGNAELARLDAGENPQALLSLDEIRKAGHRAKNLIQQILAFSRRQPTARVVLALRPVVEDCVRLLRATLPARVEIACRTLPGTPEILADPTQVEQILLNLGTNANDAMDGAPGRLDIVVEPVTVTTDTARPDLRPGRYARIAVSDSGHGMDAATQARIFEPFYTTKAVGAGTGLGLAVVHGIMRNHDGTIVVHSAPGQGARFELYFPVAAVPDGLGPMPPTTPVASEGRGQHILYIDDDEALVLLVKRLLERRGYRVTGFTDPREALAAVRAAPGRFDLAVTDYNMPGMSGLDAAAALLAVCPALPIALASGFVTDELRARAAAVGVRDVIFKPNVVEEFCDVVQRLAPVAAH